MDFLDRLFDGLTILVALVATVNVLQQVERVRAKREYKRRFKNAQEFTRQLREQLGEVQGDTEGFPGESSDSTPEQAHP